jgi:hypothetical protein
MECKNPIITGHDPRYGIFSNALGTLYPVHENIHMAWDKRARAFGNILHNRGPESRVTKNILKKAWTIRALVMEYSHH